MIIIISTTVGHGRDRGRAEGAGEALPPPQPGAVRDPRGHHPGGGGVDARVRPGHCSSETQAETHSGALPAGPRQDVQENVRERKRYTGISLSGK